MQLRSRLDPRARAIVDATRIRCPIKVAGSIKNESANGVESVRVAREAIEHAFCPGTAGGLFEFKNSSAAGGPA